LARDPRVSGFSLVRAARECGYPVIESVRSALPLVEEMIVVVHRGDDDTREMLTALHDRRLVLAEADWDAGPRRRGLVLSHLTNLALARCRHPWALYLQADEVVHEDDYDTIRAALSRWDGRPRVDALTFRYLHFEGSYGRVNPLRYRRQSRLVRNDGRLQSVRDAAGFARTDGRRLVAHPSGARIFHYGWANAPEALKAKTLALARLYHAEDEVARRFGAVRGEDLARPDLAFRWRGSHPGVMRERIGRVHWDVGRYRGAPWGTPLLNRDFYAAWLRKWRVLPRWPARGGAL
jgi:hypothetical protein